MIRNTLLKHFLLFLACFAIDFTPGIRAGVISIPNGSFESPRTEFADPRLDSWQKTPKPDWFVENDQQHWDQLVGVFKNTAEGMADHIDNVDGDQGLFLFSVPTAGFFQDYDTISGTNSAPSHEFDAVFEPGNAYTLTVGVIGGGGGMPEGATMLALLYYRDAADTMIPVGSVSITNSPAVFPNTTHFVDFSLTLPPVQSTNEWAGKHIGILFTSTAAPELAAGYWDLDNVRLSASGPSAGGPELEISRAGDEVRLSWISTAGKTYQVERSEDLHNWSTQGEPLAGTGAELAQNAPLSAAAHGYFRLLESPAL
jgi:hypothetical protein